MKHLTKFLCVTIVFLFIHNISLAQQVEKSEPKQKQLLYDLDENGNLYLYKKKRSDTLIHTNTIKKERVKLIEETPKQLIYEKVYLEIGDQAIELKEKQQTNRPK